jgi:uncharacterized spore protein YtfJ
MRASDVIDAARDQITASRVFGETRQVDGLTIIPAAAVVGGLGGGAGRSEKGEDGEGAGFGMSGRPVGAYTIKDGHLSWHPAIDVNRIISMVGLIVIAYVLSRPRMARARGGLPQTRRTRSIGLPLASSSTSLSR